jgi:hypothetical protein
MRLVPSRAGSPARLESLESDRQSITAPKCASRKLVGATPAKVATAKRQKRSTVSPAA